MRGDDVQQEAMFSYLSPEARVPQDCGQIRAQGELAGGGLPIKSAADGLHFY